MTYDAYDAAVGIDNGTYPKTTQTFQFDKGTIGNTNFMAIAANSANKAGAMVAINEMMSPEIQDAMSGLREFLFERVYTNQDAKGEEGKAIHMITSL